MPYSEKVQLAPGVTLRQKVAEDVLDAVANNDAYRACNILRNHFPALTLFAAKRVVDKIRKEWC